ncbi:LysR family transcriptional regulator [Burkholderia sp. KK1]|nr:LysR family transcriptional regulator [Burkholderia sp. KK1]
MDIKDIEVFIAAARAESLAAAARQLNLTPMSATRRLATLEQDLGVRLIHRTTRSLSLTPEGEEFLPFARTMLDAAEEAHSALSPSNTRAKGLLRVTAPALFGRLWIQPLIPDFLNSNPDVQVELTLTDSLVDLAASGTDVAIRIAPLRDSELVARAIARNPRVLCASPQYIEKNGAPRLLADVSRHACLRLASMPYWPFDQNGQTRSVRVDGRYACTTVEGVRAACLQSLGLALMTYLDVCTELEAKTLIRVGLEDVKDQELSIWAVLPTRQYVPVRVRHFLKALEASLVSEEL